MKMSSFICRAKTERHLRAMRTQPALSTATLIKMRNVVAARLVGNGTQEGVNSVLVMRHGILLTCYRFVSCGNDVHNLALMFVDLALAFFFGRFGH